MKVTQAQLDSMAYRFARSCGHNYWHLGEIVHDGTTQWDGRWYLDHEGNGWLIVERSGVSAEHHPFGSERRSGSALWEYMRFAITAVDYATTSEQHTRRVGDWLWRISKEG